MERVFDFIANTTDGVFAVDRHQTIVLWNEGATALLDFTADEVIGRKCEEVLRARDAQGCAVCRRDCEMLKTASRLAISPTIDVKARTKNGQEVWLNVSSIVVPSIHHRLSVYIHIFRDVTHQHELEEATREFSSAVSGLSAEPEAHGSPDRSADLTERERDVMAHLVRGASTQAIAERLCISPRTVRNHVNNILEKLNVHSRLEAVAYLSRREPA